MDRIPNTKPAIDLPSLVLEGVEVDNNFDSRSVDNSFKSPPIESVIGCS